MAICSPLAYTLMPNHWHLVLWPKRDGDLSEFLRWLTVTHTQRYRAHYHTEGAGPVYQGRFKSFPVQEDEHLLTVLRYVERNALRAGLVRLAADWRWSSLWQRSHGFGVGWLDEGPIALPRNWVGHVEATTSILVRLQATAQHAEAVGFVRGHVCDRTELV